MKSMGYLSDNELQGEEWLRSWLGDVTNLPWIPNLNMSEAQRAVSSTVVPAKQLLITTEGAAYIGDGVSQASALQPVAARVWRSGASYTPGIPVQLPTGELVRSPTTFISGSTYSTANNGNPINWPPLPEAVKTRQRTPDPIRRLIPKRKVLTTIPTNVTAGTTTGSISNGGPVTQVPVNLTAPLTAGLFRITDGTNYESFYTANAVGTGASTITVTSKTPTNSFSSGVNVEQGFGWPVGAPTPNVYRGEYGNALTDFDVRVFRNNVGKLGAAKLARGTAVTSLTVNALPGALSAGDIITLVAPDGHCQSMQVGVGGAAQNATTLPVADLTAANGSVVLQYDFPGYNPNDPAAGTIITHAWFIDSLDGSGNNTGKAVAKITTALATGVAITSLAVSGNTLANIPANSSLVAVYTDDQGIIHKQRFFTAPGATAGSASITVNSQVVNYAFPPGTQLLSPFATFQQCYNASAAGDSFIIMDRRSNANNGVMYDNQCSFGWTGVQAIDKSLNFIAMFPGEPRYVTGYNNLSWSPTGGQAGVFQATQDHACRAIDIAAGPREGVELYLASSIADCQARPGSWYTDGTTVYMHTQEGNAPDNSRHIVLLTINSFVTTSNTAAMNLYFQGFDIFGGNKGCTSVVPTTFRINQYNYRMGFFWPATSTNDANAMSFRCGKYCFSQECYIVGAQSDNFSYHGFDLVTGGLVEAPVFLEINCISHSAGYHGGVVNPNPALLNINNATTCHGGTKGIRIGGLYRGGSGVPVADVHQNTQSVAYACSAGDSEATDRNLDSSWSAQQPYTEMWIYDSRGYGSPHSDVWAATGTVVHADNCEFDTRQQQVGALLLETNPL